MNKKGFSLVEMLLVLVLIAIVSMIILPNISKMTSSSKQKEINGYINLLKENLNLYVIDKKGSINWVSDTAEITFDELKKVNPDINIKTCTVTRLKINRESKESIVDNVYSYSFDICISCEGTEHCN